MKFYQVNKSRLKFKEIPQIQYNWNIPILIDNELNVIAGNSLKDCLPDNVFVVVVDNFDREVLFTAIYDIECKIAEENSKERFDLIYGSFFNFFREVRKPKIKKIDLFTYQECGEITPETYVEPPAYDFNKHGKQKPLFNEGFVLSEEFIEEVVRKGQPEIEVDLEILKELL